MKTLVRSLKNITKQMMILFCDFNDKSHLCCKTSCCSMLLKMFVVFVLRYFLMIFNE